MTAGFSIIHRGDRLQLQLHGDRAPGDRQLVTHAQQSALHAVLMGRLYYGHGLTSDARARAGGDAALALAAYRQWGTRFIDRLEGDFCLVIWDAEQRRLLAARDPMGGFPLFWTRQGGELALSTRMESLLARLPSRRLDLAYVAEYLSRRHTAVEEAASETCIYQDVHRVVAGTLVTMHPVTGAVTRRSYWNWLDRMVDPGTSRLDDIADQVEARFRAAVRERIRGRTAAHLSGGMDSSAVALVARDWIAAGAGEPPLHALSLVYERLGDLAQETRYLDSVLRGQAGIVAHRIDGDDLLAYDAFANPVAHDEPSCALFAMAGQRRMTESAAATGAATILTGVCGDTVADVLPYHIADLLRGGRLLAAWRETLRWTRIYNREPWSFFRQYGLDQLMPTRLRAGVRALLRHGQVDWRQQREGTVAPWIAPGFARAHDLHGRGLDNLRRTYRACGSTSLSVALASIEMHVGDFYRWHVAAPHGIMLTDPFADPRLLCLGLGIRTRFRQQPGEQKPILAHAMRDVLPADLRARRTKRNFNPVYYKGLARNLPALEALIRRSRADELGLLDKTALLACLRQAALGIDDACIGTMHLDRTLCLIKWLVMQDEGRGAAQAPAEVIELPLVPSRVETELVPS